ncbi:unnamed protein product [Porites evermanni]|uniref:Uncharacterized protein n=1 Tax=Porites evermanni TaxID=104178 RepID=A0ABN8M1I2_9CNID|nr:unnamed protein product [Porites evermanni]
MAPPTTMNCSLLQMTYQLSKYLPFTVPSTWFVTPRSSSEQIAGSHCVLLPVQSQQGRAKFFIGFFFLRLVIVIVAKLTLVAVISSKVLIAFARFVVKCRRSVMARVVFLERLVMTELEHPITNDHFLIPNGLYYSTDSTQFNSINCENFHKIFDRRYTALDSSSIISCMVGLASGSVFRHRRTRPLKVRFVISRTCCSRLLGSGTCRMHISQRSTPKL